MGTFLLGVSLILGVFAFAGAIADKLCGGARPTRTRGRRVRGGASRAPRRTTRPSPTPLGPKRAPVVARGRTTTSLRLAQPHPDGGEAEALNLRVPPERRDARPVGEPAVTVLYDRARPFIRRAGANPCGAGPSFFDQDAS